jgi:hypothetical protein
VMYFRNFFYDESVEQLDLAINGGRTEEGDVITGLPLTDAPLVAEYYFTYGLALARTDQCGDALLIAQKLETNLPDDENVVFAASEIARICQEALDNPVVEATETLGADEEAAAEEPTEDAEEIEVTATP